MQFLKSMWTALVTWFRPRRDAFVRSMVTGLITFVSTAFLAVTNFLQQLIDALSTGEPIPDTSNLVSILVAAILGLAAFTLNVIVRLFKPGQPLPPPPPPPPSLF